MTKVLSVNRDAKGLLSSPQISTFHLKVNEMFSSVHHITAKVPGNDAVPCRTVFLVKLLFNIGSDILLYVVLLHCLQGTVYSILAVDCAKQTGLCFAITKQRPVFWKDL
uniref:Uncharacterized protein n=1 Tax=Poecilia reticulata TaxID=8081 RepID=A0A3P9NYR4_POERE